MENSSTLLTMPSIVDLELPHVASGGKRFGYYLVITALLLVVWFMQSRKQTSVLGVPFYKASKTKWIFDAETLIKDSYTKVS